MKKNNLKLSIIINHYRTPEVLKMCLDSVIKNVKDVSYEIIVTDSGTQDITVELLKKYPEVIFLEERRDIGFSKSVNKGVKEASGEFMFVINADILIKKVGDVEKMLSYYENNSDTGILSPKLLNIDGSVQQSFFREYTPLAVIAKRTSFKNTRFGKNAIKRMEYDNQKPSEAFEVEWLMGSSLLFSRDRLEKVGGVLMDERYFMYFEDSDLCRRIRNAGFKNIYYPKVVMDHHHKRESNSGGGVFDIFTNWLTRVHIKSYIKFLWKWNIEVPVKKIFKNS